MIQTANHMLQRVEQVRLDQLIGYIDVALQSKAPDALIEYIKQGK